LNDYLAREFPQGDFYGRTYESAVYPTITTAPNANAVGGTTEAAENIGNPVRPSSFSRTIDRAPTNPKNYTLREKDLLEGGHGLSTISDEVSPATVLEETGRRRLVQFPGNDVPPGLEWIKTPGGYGKPILDNNHWELWHPQSFAEMGAGQYVDWWNTKVAPTLAELAENWLVFK
jgi:hypothetical protein